MLINKALPYITSICVYAYSQYHNIILNEQVNIPDAVYNKISRMIYIYYTTAYTDGYIEEIGIGDWIYHKSYKLIDIIHSDIDLRLDIVDYIKKENRPIQLISL